MTRIVAWDSGDQLAIISDAPGGGDASDMTADRNRPAVDPTNWMDYVHFNARFNYFVAATGFPQTVSVDLDEYDADAGTTFGALTSYTSHTGKDYTLAAHGLGVVPADWLGAVNGQEYPIGAPIQVGVNGGRRSISFWCDDTNIYLHEDVKPGVSGLPALSIDVYVVVFRATEDDGTSPLLSTNPMQLGRGRIKASEINLRETQTGDSAPFTIPTGPCGDLANGHFRFVLLNMLTYDVGPIMGKDAYNGSFWGGPQKLVGFPG
jgi:hypothetical protein